MAASIVLANNSSETKLQSFEGEWSYGIAKSRPAAMIYAPCGGIGVCIATLGIGREGMYVHSGNGIVTINTLDPEMAVKAVRIIHGQP